MNQKFIIFFLLTASASADNPCEGLHLEFVNDPTGCSRYFSCVNGVAHPLECREGFWFFNGVCYRAGTVPCDVCPSEGVIYIPVEGSCTKYIFCINGEGLERECAPGARFDPRAGSCNLQELVACAYVDCPRDGIHIVPDPSSCRHYAICEDGEQIERRECLEGLLFDPVELICSRAEHVSCATRTAKIFSFRPN